MPRTRWLAVTATAFACSTLPPAEEPGSSRDSVRREPPKSARVAPDEPDEPPPEVDERPEQEGPDERSLEVTATAYNSLPGQTWGDPTLAAWGDRLRPGMRAIAVSRDLLELGLDHGTKVRIEGVPGSWRVLDKTHRRWKRRIDLYMGEDVRAARRWGKRTVRIYWTPDSDEIADR